jgi:hypothetical protein
MEVIMKRFLIFATLWPILGFVWGFWIVLQISNWSVGAPLTFDYHQVNLLPTAYIVGIVPALLLAWLDDVLATRNMRYRVGCTALVAYVISYVPMLGALSLPFMHDPYIWLLGIIGAVPGAVCSWLATDEPNTLMRERDKRRIGAIKRTTF